MKVKQYGIITLLLLWLFFVSALWAKAQEPPQTPPTSTPPTETVTGNELSTSPRLTETVIGDKFTYNLTWPQLQYPEQILNEADSDTTYDLYLPADVVPTETGNYVDLVLSHTAPQTGRQTDLSVSFNGNLLQIVPLTVENANRAPLRLELPGKLIEPGRNRLLVKLNANLVCGEILTSTVAAIIHPESSFHLEYTLPSRQPDLGVYPVPFYEQTFLPNQTYFVLPQKPTATDLSVAASISAGLGILTQGEIRVASVLENELTDEIKLNNHLIIIGRPEANSLLTQLDLPLALDNSLIKADSGVLQEIISPWNSRKMVLVVTGQTDPGLIKAGDVLNRDLNFLGMTGPVAIVDEVQPPYQTSARRTIDLTFDALGYEDVAFYGTRPQEMRFEFMMPQSWEMTEEAKLFLSFNHSTVINPEKSTINIELNRVPVGGVALNAQNALDGVLELQLPGWLLQPGLNRLQANINMLTTEDPCIDLDNHQAWTVIRRDSYIHLPYVEQEAAFDLGLFPFPFDTNPNLTNVALVVPETLNRPVRDRLLQLAVLLGQEAGGDRLTLRAVNAQDIDDKTREGYHFIVFGRPTNNALLRDINKELPQPFQADTDQLAPGLDSAVFTEIASRSAGLLQELPSPWNADNTILAITGTTDEGVAAALDLLLGNLPPELLSTVELAGNLAVIEGQRIYSTDTRLLKDSSLSQKSTQVEPVIQSGASSQGELVNRWW